MRRIQKDSFHGLPSLASIEKEAQVTVLSHLSRGNGEQEQLHFNKTTNTFSNWTLSFSKS